MSDFQAWFDKVSAEAHATEFGAKLRAAGFCVWHSGGGCLAWIKTGEAGRFGLITNDDGGLPEPGFPIWTGLQDEDGDVEADLHETDDIDAAIAAAADLLALKP